MEQVQVEAFCFLLNSHLPPQVIKHGYCWQSVFGEIIRRIIVFFWEADASQNASFLP